jgi:hypothetical protein
MAAIYAFKMNGTLIEQAVRWDGTETRLPAGYEEVSEAVWLSAKAGDTRNGGSITARAIRSVPVAAFFDRLTVAETEAIETLAATRPRIAAWLRRLTIRAFVDLDSAELTAICAYLKAQGVPTLWADNATADARIAAIRA